MDVVVLNDWVTLTKVTPLRSKDLHQLGKIHEGAAEPINLVNHYHVDFAGFDFREQPPQGRALQSI
jgi:hypothetical protein